MLWDNPNVKSGAEKFGQAEVVEPKSSQPRSLTWLRVTLVVTGAALRVDSGRLGRL
jgi:hypothetical protein